MNGHPHVTILPRLTAGALAFAVVFAAGCAGSGNSSDRKSVV